MDDLGKGGGMSPRALLTGLLSVVFVTASVSGVLLLAHATEPTRGSDAAVARRVADDSAAAAAQAASAFGVGSARSAALRILSRWDHRRSTAYADGDVAALRRLYAPGSHAGRADVAILADYVGRGLRVEGLRMQVLAFRVVRRTPSRMVLAVTDRLVGARAVRGTRHVGLPTDRADRRRITMVRRDGRWVVSEVH